MEEGESRIKKTVDSLYSRNAPEQKLERHQIKPNKFDVSDKWVPEEMPIKRIVSEEERIAKQKSFFNKLLLGSIIFFVVAVGIAGFMIWNEGLVSPNKVQVSVDGLSSVAAGNELDLNVKILNKNNVDLNQAEINVVYPDGTRSSEDVNQPLTRYNDSLGNIPANSSTVKTIKAIFFGEKDSVQQIRINVKYTMRGSDAVFTTSEANYPVKISSSPISLSVSYPNQASSGQNIDMAVSISSNSDQKIQDALLQVNYPFGFNFKSANPSPDFGNNTWRLGDLNPKSKKVIDIKGVIEGQDNEDKIFTFNAGLADPNDERSMGVGIISSMQKITLKQPFVGLDIKINGDSGKDFVTKIGNKMNAEIAISNNLPVAVNNANVQVSLSGNILNKSSVNASNGGFYRSSDNTISWDKNGESILSLLSPGQNSSLSFNFMTLPYSSNMISAFHNAEVDIDVTLKGDVKSDSLPSQIVSTFSKKIKISTDLTLNPRLLYSVGAFKNTGPIPPKADIQTTYTVDWIVTNSFNDVSGAVVKATLPPYVTWLGSYSPQSEKISYNPDNRTVTWELGNIPSGAGFSGSSREVGFQVGVTPSQNQIGSAPVVINETTISGTDNFTGQSAGATKASLNTRISTDPKYNYGDEKVNP